MASDAPKKSTPSGLRIALLIDADNASADHIGQVIKSIEGRGFVTIRRAYGNWAKPTLSSWAKILHTHAIEPIQLFDLSKGKNATDIRLVIDAMDLLASTEVDAFAIHSSDCDFTPLSIRLREAGKPVFGFGEAKTPKPFVQSCTTFLSLNESKNSSGKAAHHQPSLNQIEHDPALIVALEAAINESKNEIGWSPLARVGERFKSKSYGHASLKKLIAKIDLFDLKECQMGEKRIPCVRKKTNS